MRQNNFNRIGDRGGSQNQKRRRMKMSVNEFNDRRPNSRARWEKILQLPSFFLISLLKRLIRVDCTTAAFVCNLNATSTKRKITPWYWLFAAVDLLTQFTVSSFLSKSLKQPQMSRLISLIFFSLVVPHRHDVSTMITLLKFKSWTKHSQHKCDNENFT